MKKLINTLPSTKPDIFYESQPTFASNFEIQPKSYQAQLQNVINQIKKVHKYRCNLLARDVQEIFKSGMNLFIDLLSVSSSNQLWDLMNENNAPEINENLQLNLLLTVLLQMNKCKYRCGDEANIKKFDEFRAVIEWFIPQIVLFQAHLRQKIEEQIMASCETQKIRRQAEFHNYAESTKREFEMMEEIRVQNLNRRMSQERHYKQEEIRSKIANNLYKARASSQLKEAKDTSLLRKLAPYRWDKKRVYEDSTYRHTIEDILQSDEQRRLKIIANMKKVQQQKLRRVHDNLVSTQDMRAETERDRMMMSLINDKHELKNNEQKNFNNLKHSIDIANNARLSKLKKSLQAFTLHQDTLKIKEIMSNHHYKVQFSNRIEEIVKPQAQMKSMNSRYLTIHTERLSNDMGKNLQRHQNRLQKQLKLLGSEQDQEVRRSMVGRKKSLVDLYDKSLNLVT